MAQSGGFNLKFRKGDKVIYIGGNFTIPARYKNCSAIVTRTGQGFKGQAYEIVFVVSKYICHEKRLILKEPGPRTGTGTQWWV